ncbi:RagB/SusD family nutrient uptake outer membrane protein [Dawidia soli]|uniref:RagB/SusD family nutrient uptake outer membrane protein n=1 Tax=Dawidia soli TaxID=2782352 RepID=A0AAP2GE75_9BACT|nr:RagB/SusD family nutrient uptake outer membrane protein [Dawidia soli]MBT1688057.1 RagB/SusD family nutrient uptake outer membrane protein [Dawidia soli]
MKSIQRNTGMMIVMLISLLACNDDFLNTQPLNEVLTDRVWKDASLAQAFVTDIYNGLGNGGFDEQMVASLTDEAIFTHPGRGINTITESRSNPADQGWINNTLNWTQMYQRIRACNLALENLAAPQFENTAGIEADRLRGEAHFMRAYFYQQLLRYYGGIPLIDRSYTLGESDYTVARNTYEECVNFIVADCDAAAQLLQGKNMASGRASYAGALALKSRVLLYAASDLHDIPTAAAKSDVVAKAKQPAVIGYTTGDRVARWQKARDAAKAVLDIGGLGYEVALAAPVTPEQGTANHSNAALARNGGERELIFARYFINAKDEGGAWVGRNNGPNGYHNWAGNTPIQNLVDDFEMIDGTSFDWNNPAHASAPYANRDPRFYATILYDGAGWKPRTADVAAKDPYNEIQTGQYQIVSASGAVTTYFGLDTRQSSVEDWNGSRTGYYMRKFIDSDPAVVDQNTRQQIPWPILRFTEAILNYVEACIELGEDEEARTWLNKVRFRAGMPAVAESGEALKERYRNERRVEMAYEEQRYHDARRWMIAAETIGQKAVRMNITATLKPGKDVKIYRYDTDSYNYVYEAQEIDPGIENRLWLDKMYYLPIHRDEINRNNKLVQNPGYEATDVP